MYKIRTMREFKKEYIASEYPKHKAILNCLLQNDLTFTNVKQNYSLDGDELDIIILNFIGMDNYRKYNKTGKIPFFTITSNIEGPIAQKMILKSVNKEYRRDYPRKGDKMEMLLWTIIGCFFLGGGILGIVLGLFNAKDQYVQVQLMMMFIGLLALIRPLLYYYEIYFSYF